MQNFDSLEVSDLEALTLVSKTVGNLSQFILQRRGVFAQRQKAYTKKLNSAFRLGEWWVKEFIEKYQVPLSKVESLNLREIDTSTALVKFLDKNCPHLVKLRLKTIKAEEETLRSLPKRIVSLWLDFIQNEDNLLHLGQLKELKELKVGNYYVTDKGLSHLLGITGLTHLILSACRITDDGLAQLSGLKNLTFLELHCDYCIHGNCFTKFTNLQILKLYLCNEKITDVSLSYLSRLTALKKIIVTYCIGITDEGIRKHLSCLTDLKVEKIDFGW